MISKKENIAQYILSLWQVERYVRAFPQEAEKSKELQEILQMMHTEGIMEKGHLQIVNNAMQQVEEIHNELLQENATYRAKFMQLSTSLTLFKSKTMEPTISDIQACFVLLDDICLLALKKQTISPETLAVKEQVTELLKFISKTFRDEQVTDEM